MCLISRLLRIRVRNRTFPHTAHLRLDDDDRGERKFCGLRVAGARRRSSTCEARFYRDAVTWRRFWSQYRSRDSPAPRAAEDGAKRWRRRYDVGCQRPFIRHPRPTPIDYALAFAQSSSIVAFTCRSLDLVLCGQLWPCEYSRRSLLCVLYIRVLSFYSKTCNPIANFLFRLATNSSVLSFNNNVYRQLN